MYRFAICDDRKEDIDYIEAIIRKWNRKAGLQLMIEGFPSGEAFLFAYEEDRDFDVLFLDIEMKSLSGIDLAQTDGITDSDCLCDRVSGLYRTGL